MSKTKYRVELNGEVIGRRTSDRTYTHAVVIDRPDLEMPKVVSFCGRHELALKEAGKWRHNENRVIIVPVVS